MLTIEEKTF